MTIATVAAAHKQFGSTATATSASFNTTGSDLIVVHVGESAFTLGTIAVSDNQGNSYTALTSQATAGSVKSRSCLYYKLAPTTSATHTITITVGGSPFVLNWSAEVQGFSGVSATGFDAESGANNTTATIQPGSLTPAVSNSLIVSGYAGTTGTSDATVDSSFTITDKLLSGPKSALAYLVQGSASAVNPTWSSNAGSGDETAVMAVFKPSGGAAVNKGLLDFF